MAENHDESKPDYKTDPEYILKGVQAFSIGVALFAASIAVAHAAISQTQNDTPLEIKIIYGVLLLVLNVGISTFGCIGLILGLNMTGIVEMKGPIEIFNWGVTASWIVLAFVIAGFM